MELIEFFFLFQKNENEDIGHLLSEELAQMDQAIADATKRISEILAKSRGSDQGVKLEVCSLLNMVHNFKLKKQTSCEDLFYRY